MKTILCLLICGVFMVSGVAYCAEGLPKIISTSQEEVLHPMPCISSAMRVVNPRMVEVLAHHLSLDDNTKDNVRRLLQDRYEEARPLIEKQRETATSFAEELQKPDNEEFVIVAAAERAFEAEKKLVSHHIRTFVTMRNMLDENQKKRLGDMLAVWQPQKTGGKKTPAPGE